MSQQYTCPRVQLSSGNNVSKVNLSYCSSAIVEGQNHRLAQLSLVVIVQPVQPKINLCLGFKIILGHNLSIVLISKRQTVNIHFSAVLFLQQFLRHSRSKTPDTQIRHMTLKSNCATYLCARTHNYNTVWKNNLKCSITKENRAELVLNFHTN